MVFIWNLYFSMLTSHCMIVGHKIKHAGKFTAILVHKIVHNESNQIYVEILEKMSLQIVHRLPTFSGGLFDYDLKLLFSVSFQIR